MMICFRRAMIFDSDNSRDDSTQPMLFWRPGPRTGEQPALYRPVLICVDGPQRGARYLLTKPETVLGRSSSVEVVLKDEMASRRHARVVYRNWNHPEERPECFVEDMNSRNGTELNGDLLKAGAKLRERDRIQIGTTLFGFFLRDEEELEHDRLLYEMATRDALTGLDNRHQFRTHVAHHIERARRNRRPVAMLVIDVDKFKLVNDQYGHDIGDRALIHLARMVQSCCRSTEIVARYGGEEFVVLLPESSREGAVQVAERIRAAVEASPLRLASGPLPLTVSIGVAELGVTDDSTAFFRRADQQLLKAKESGRNRVMVDESVGGVGG